MRTGSLSLIQDIGNQPDPQPWSFLTTEKLPAPEHSPRVQIPWRIQQTHWRSDLQALGTSEDVRPRVRYVAQEVSLFAHEQSEIKTKLEKSPL